MKLPIAKCVSSGRYGPTNAKQRATSRARGDLIRRLANDAVQPFDAFRRIADRFRSLHDPIDRTVIVNRIYQNAENISLG